jgi:ADP-heptose:LPS heptosyltransferase
VQVPLTTGVRVGDAPNAAPEVIEAWCAEQRAHRYDLVVQLHGGGRNSNALLLRLGARTTAGRPPGRPKPDRWTPYTAYQHDTLRWLEVVATVGARALRLEPHLAVTDEDLRESRAVLPHGDAPLVAVHPGATDARRCYPEERLGAVARTLADRGARVVVLGGPGEQERVDRVVAGFGRDVETVVGARRWAGCSAPSPAARSCSATTAARATWPPPSGRRRSPCSPTPTSPTSRRCRGPGTA